MGTVYLGRSPGGRPAAIKVINVGLESDPEALLRFRREAETLRTIRNAYTAGLIDCELTTPPYWMATEYIPGPTLAAAVADRGPMPVEECFRLAAALAEGLADIHAHGICHRDLKPANIILSTTGPRLIDFGLARGLAEFGLTQPGMAVGTAGYAAPESMEGMELTPAADVFALGATVALAATARRPYGTGSMDSIYLRSSKEDIDVTGVEPELAGLIRSCVARDPRRRPSLDQVIERCRDRRLANLNDTTDLRSAAMPKPGADLKAVGAREQLGSPGAAAQPFQPGVKVLSFPPGAGVPPFQPGGEARPFQPGVGVPSFQPGTGAPAAAPKGRRKRVLLIAGIVAALVLFVCGGAVALHTFAASRSGGRSTTTHISASPAAASASPSTATSLPAQLNAGTVAPQPRVLTVTSEDGRCIQLPQNHANGTRVAAQACDGSASQQWGFTGKGAIVQVATKKCLDIGGHDGSDLGFRIQLWDCNSKASQAWVSTEYNLLYNAASGRCLSILPVSEGGPALGLQPCTQAANELWSIP